MRQFTSIIILSYNTRQLTQGCIESIRRFTEEGSYEIIVVDNGSKDDSVEWLKEQSDVILIANHENHGFPGGCNQGLSVAKGNELLLLNSDTIVTKCWLENLRAALHSDKMVGAVGCMTNSCSNFQQIDVTYSNYDELQDFAFEFNRSDSNKWKPWFMLVGYCLLIKKEVFDKVGYLDEQFNPGNFEDDDYCIRMRLCGYELLLCKDTFIHHYGSSSFLKGQNYEEKNAKQKKYDRLTSINKNKLLSKYELHNADYRVMHGIVNAVYAMLPQNVTVLLADVLCAGDLFYLADKRPDLRLIGVTSNKTAYKIMKNSFDIIESDNIIYGLGGVKENVDYIVLVTKKYNNIYEILNGIMYNIYTAYSHVVYDNGHAIVDVKIPRAKAKVTACYIVKNEVETLPKSIRSIQGEFDELVVIDTGSTDNTMKVAKNMGAIVKTYIWDNDFAAARNYAVSIATGDWIIFLDADQYYVGDISIHNICEILNTDSNRKYDGILVAIYDEGREECPPSRECKIFRKDPLLQYKGKIHEILQKKNGNLNLLEKREFVFMHSGYRGRLLEKKARRNLEILLEVIEKEGIKESDYFYLADCSFNLKEYKEALFFSRKAVASSLVTLDKDVKMYIIMIESMRQCDLPVEEMLLTIDKALQKYPKILELHAERGMVLSVMRAFDEALKSFWECICLYKSKEKNLQSYGVFNDDNMMIVYNRMAEIYFINGQWLMSEIMRHWI